MFKGALHVVCMGSDRRRTAALRALMKRLPSVCLAFVQRTLSSREGSWPGPTQMRLLQHEFMYGQPPQKVVCLGHRKEPCFRSEHTIGKQFQKCYSMAKIIRRAGKAATIVAWAQGSVHSVSQTTQKHTVGPKRLAALNLRILKPSGAKRKVLKARRR
eukprot:14115868-Heterocapsa_arctica.AAC.1